METLAHATWLISNTSALSNLYHFYSLYSARKYVGQYSGFIAQTAQTHRMITRAILERHHDHLALSQPSPELACCPNRALHFPGHERSISCFFCLPDNPFFLLNEGVDLVHAVQEATYACTFKILCQLCIH
jgi:glutamate dehydrogenase